MEGYYILNEDGEPVEAANMEEWARFFESGKRRIARDERGGVTVSTVFLGTDHSFGSGWPVLFETMVFGGPHDQRMERYCTRKEAIEGHARVVEEVFDEWAQLGGDDD